MRIGKHPTVTSDRQCLKIRGKEKTKNSQVEEFGTSLGGKLPRGHRFESCLDYNDRILLYKNKFFKIKIVRWRNGRRPE